MTAANAKPIASFTCDKCKTSKPGKKAKCDSSAPANGWKRVGEELLCGDCVSLYYFVTVASVRVSGLDGDTWKDFRESLDFAWGESTRIANWASSTLLSHETFSGWGEKTPKKKLMDIYNICKNDEIRRGFPSACTLKTIKRVEAVYNAKRIDICRGRASAPSFRFPQPFYIEPGKTTIVKDGERYKVHVTLPSKSGVSRKWSLVLASGWRNRRTAATISSVVDGTASCREISITGQGGGKIIMVRVACLIPKKDKPKAEGTLLVRSTPDTFCEAISAASNRIWATHEDLMFRWIAEHRRRLQNIGDDRKAERRRHAAKRGLDRHVDTICDKHRNRIKSRIGQLASELCNWAKREDAGCILWDDWPPAQSAPNNTRFRQFPWHQFREALERKLESEGITLVRQGVAKAPVSEDDPVSLA